MTRGKAQAGEDKELRANAEKKLNSISSVKSLYPVKSKKIVRLREQTLQLDKLRAENPGKMLHELRVHQIELEMQNEELRRAQQELEDSRNKYADLYDFAPVGYFTFDKHGHIIDANLTGCRMLGVERANLVKKPFSSFVDKESQDKFYLHRKAVLTPGLKQSCEIELFRKDGDKFYAQLESVHAADAKGDLSLCRTAITDISERKRMENELRKLASVVEYTSEFIGLASLDGKIIFQNRAAAEMTGLPAGEIEQIPILDVIPEHLKEKVQNEVLPTLRKTGRWEGELQYKNLKTGKLTDVYATTFTINDPKTAKPLYLANTSIDITERKKDDKRLRQIAEELERSNRDLEQFAYVASHDLKEPLRAIGGFVELLLRKYKDKLDQKAQEYIQYAIGGTKRMEELIRGLLDYSRIKTTGEKMVPIPSKAALKEAKENLQRDIEESKAVITNDDLPEIKADGRQIIQVFQHLLDNAIKFSDKGKPKIHVGCEKKNGSWQFAITDNGIGIEQRFHNRIFDIFQQLHSRDKYPGYGVGLTVCRRIIERHGGKMWVDSQPGKGATFFFTIPA